MNQQRKTSSGRGGTAQSRIARRNRIILALLAAVVALCALSGTLVGLLIAQKHRYSAERDALAASANADSERHAGTIDEINAQLSELDGEKDALENQLSDAQSELDALTGTITDYETLKNELSAKIMSLNEELIGKNQEIDRLKKQLADLQKVFAVDVNAQYEILAQLEKLLAQPPMIHRTVENDGISEPVESPEEPARIALYYEDITSGNRYAYHADERFDSASCVKAPYILALLELASQEDAELAAKKEAALAADPTLAEGWEDGPRTYDFSQTIVYTAEQYPATGSGEIAQSGEGKVYSYRDLIYHVLECSDNVGYSVIRGAYGPAPLKSLIQRLQLRSMMESTIYMSPRDAGTIMKAIYDFTESDAAYASFMKDAMIGSRQSVLTAAAAAPKKVAHKYGWSEGAYHDMAIVYDEHPYVVAIMTDCDEGTKEINAYLCSILRLIDQLHDNFYKQR